MNSTTSRSTLEKANLPLVIGLSDSPCWKVPSRVRVCVCVTTNAQDQMNHNKTLVDSTLFLYSLEQVLPQRRSSVSACHRCWRLCQPTRPVSSAFMIPSASPKSLSASQSRIHQLALPFPPLNSSLANNNFLPHAFLTSF